MSDPDNFIARWSRRKRAAAEHAGEKSSQESKPPATPDAATEPAHSGEDARAARAAPEPPELPFDLAKLPPIESITAESDIRAFLAPGVPADLTRAALRRAWAADPKIRDFVGLADYDWDFNTPGAIAGFGPLEMTDELRRQVEQMVGRSLAAEAPERPAPTPTEVPAGQAMVEASGTSIESGVTTDEPPSREAQSNVGASQGEPLRPDVELHNLLQRDKESAALQYQTENPDNVQLIAQRPRGRALPK